MNALLDIVLDWEKGCSCNADQGEFCYWCEPERFPNGHPLGPAAQVECNGYDHPAELVREFAGGEHGCIGCGVSLV